MGVDPLSSLAPARVRCLLLPYGRTTRSSFTGFINRLQHVSIVRLGDVSPGKTEETGMFAPMGFPNGSVVYEFADNATAPSHRSLIPFEIFRETLVVLAISNGGEYSKDLGEHTDAQAPHAAVGEFSECIMSIKDNYPNALVHRLLLFDFDTEGVRLPTDTMVIPSQGHGPATALKTIMADITSALLEEMSALAKSIQALPNIDTPKAVGIAFVEGDVAGRHSPRPNSRLSMAPGSGKSSPAPDVNKTKNRMSMPAHLSSPEINALNNQRSISGIGTPPSAFDEMSGVASRPSVAAADSSILSSDRLSSPQGFGPGSARERARNQAQGRINVVVGSLHLLAGRWADAAKELASSATTAKANSDYAWHAKALDLLLVALLMQAWAQSEFEIPPIAYPFADKSLAGRHKRAKSSAMNSDKTEANERPDQPNAHALQELSALIPDLANNVLHLYARAAEFSSTRVPQVVYSEAVIRYARLLWLIRSSSGTLTNADLQCLMVGAKKSVSKTIVPDDTASMHSKGDIASFVHRAMPQLDGEEYIETSDRLRILAGVASILSDLGYRRKKGLILRELVNSLLPALIQSRKDSAAELGMHPAASLSALDVTSPGGPNSLSQTSGFGGGLNNFLSIICEIYGVVLPDSVPSKSSMDTTDANDDSSMIAQRALESASLRTYGNLFLKTDILRSCINVCEALPDLPGLMRFSSSLLSTAGSGLAPGPNTLDSAPSLPVEDQIRLSTNLSKALNAARQLGQDGVEAEYWDEFFLRDITLVVDEAPNVPIARRKADLERATAGKSAETKEGPFIYNPFASKPSAVTKETLLVVNEEIVFQFLLQNLYDMDLEIEWIRLDTNDIPVDVTAKNVLIGPYRTQNVQLLCVPRKAGNLVISGCIAKIKGCRARRFPLFRSPWRMLDPLKVKHHGVPISKPKKDPETEETSESSKPAKPESGEVPVPGTFDALVIEAQPTLVLKSTSLSQSALMMLDGETRTFTITLKNASDTSIDLFLVSLEDSTAEQLKAIVADKATSVADLYEAEFNAQQQPALRLVQHALGEELSISPQGELEVEIEVFGKLGLTYGNINIEYCHLGVARSEAPDRFFTRQLNVPFEVSVNSSLGLLYNDILPLPEDVTRLVPSDATHFSDSSAGIDSIQHFYALLHRLMDVDDQTDYCLLILDFNNAWSDPVKLTLRYQPLLSNEQAPTEQEDSCSLTSIIQPLRTTRILLPFPKLLLKDSHAPIPSLDPRHKRQFVLSTVDKARPDMERLNRELFWYRQEVLQHLYATWEVSSRKDLGGESRARRGLVDLRRLRVTPRMLETLRQDDLAIDLAIRADDGSELGPSRSAPTSNGSGSRYHVRAGTFVTLSATLRSRVSHSVHPLLRLQPALRHQPHDVALDLGRKVAINGVLQRTLPVLAPGKGHTVRVGLVFLAPGEYEVGALVEEVRILPEKDPAPSSSAVDGADQPASAVDLELGKIGARTQRRTWYAREACLVDVDVDEV